MALTINVQEHWPGKATVKLNGRLDGQTVTECEYTLKEKLSENTRFLTFDLENLEYISSMGIRLLLMHRKKIEGRNGKLVTANLQPQIKKVFDIAEVLPSWGIFESVQEADAYFDKMQKDEESQ